MNAFIPKSLGRALQIEDEVTGERSNVPFNWLDEPADLTHEIGTDDRSGFNVAGTSRVTTSITFSSADIGNMVAKFPNPVMSLLATGAGTCHRGVVTTVDDTLGGPPDEYIGKNDYDSLPAIPIESVDPIVDVDRTTSKIGIDASGTYAFNSLAPSINLGYDLTVDRNRDGSVRLAFVGSHNLFPAYELIVNGALAYSASATGSGPGIFNLSAWSNFTAVVNVALPPA